MNPHTTLPSPLKITIADLAWVFLGGLLAAAAVNLSVSLATPYLTVGIDFTHFQEAVLGLVFGVLAYAAFLAAFYIRLVQIRFTGNGGSGNRAAGWRVAALQAIGLRGCQGNFITMAILAALLWLCVTAILYTSIGLWEVTLAQGRALFTPFLSTPWTLALFCVLAGPLAALTEELLFRGLLFRWLRQRWPFLPSALASGLIFALIHPYLYTTSPVLFAAFLFDLVAISVVLAFLYEISKSLWPAIITHASNNLLLIAVQLYSG